MDNFGALNGEERFNKLFEQKPSKKAIDDAKKDVKAFARALEKLRENKDKFINNSIREQYRDQETGEVKKIDTSGAMDKSQASAWVEMMLKKNYRQEDLLED